LFAVAEARFFVAARLQLVLTIFDHPIVRTHDAARAGLFLKALQFLQRGQQRSAMSTLVKMQKKQNTMLGIAESRLNSGI
jgi:hypothetical protein